MKKFRLIFDMDGTIADLYGKSDWLETIRASKPVFADLRPMAGFERVLEALETLTSITSNVEVVIASWLPMNASGNYERACAIEKAEWLQNTGFNAVVNQSNFVPYGTPKSEFVSHDMETINILFDDNAEVRAEFTEASNSQAFDENTILPVLTMLIELFR
jgi:hypothetical protein